MIRTVLFDLDGTLLDTAPDLAYALNTLLAEHDRAALAFERIRPVVSHGSIGLLRLGFGLEHGDAGFEVLRARLLAIYQEHLAVQTRPFPGTMELLDALEQRGLRWGVVTNKPGWLTEPLLRELDLDTRAACIVSGDSTARRKPHPQPMLHACRCAGSSPDECVYVGDAERDIQAGFRAGMKTLVARFGYIDSHTRLEDWRADAIIDTPMDVLAWIEAQHKEL